MKKRQVCIDLVSVCEIFSVCTHCERKILSYLVSRIIYLFINPMWTAESLTKFWICEKLNNFLNNHHIINLIGGKWSLNISLSNYRFRIFILSFLQILMFSRLENSQNFTFFGVVSSSKIPRKNRKIIWIINLASLIHG